MKKSHALTLLFISVIFTGCLPTKNEQEDLALKQQTVPYVVQPEFQFLRFGEVKPTGWILEQMRRDLKDGFSGHYDEIAPEARTDVFGGEITTRAGLDYTQWWDAETQGRWRKGLTMLAYLSDDDTARKKVDVWFDHVLKTQDTDGYLGVYGRGQRYNKTKRELCDLGAQAYLFKAMAAYVDLSGREDVLGSLKRGVDRTIAEYADGKRHVFPDNSHDLLFLDVLDWLYVRTGDTKYPHFAKWLFMDYSDCPDLLDKFGGNDSRIAWLLDNQKPFYGHGVHTISQLSIPWFLYYTTGNTIYRRAGENAIAKIQPTLLPSGIPVSQEHIVPLDPQKDIAMDYQYEYCSVLSLIESYESILRYQGDAKLGDTIEKAWFNGAQAGRLPDGEAICYLNNDTKISIPAFNPGNENQTSLAPNHVPACCNPSASQVSGQYVRAMWMRSYTNGLAAMLYGPCVLKTSMAGTRITIEERTSYPFDFDVELEINPGKPIAFPLTLRNPAWSAHTQVVCDGATIIRNGDYFILNKKWCTNDKVKVTFSADIQPEYCGGMAYLMYGPLVFAQPIPTQGKVDFGTAVNFKSRAVQPESLEAAEMLMLVNKPGQMNFGFAPKHITMGGVNSLRPFDVAPLILEGKMVRQKDGVPVNVKLVPIGSAEALLRRVTFPVE